MIYDIRQTTTYRYASPVAYARHVLRLTPIDRAGQRVHAAALDIEPAPVERREGQDFFGNRITWIALDQPHDTLTVKVAARVAVERAAVAEPARRRRGRTCATTAFAPPICRPQLARALSVPEPAGVARSGNPRLCRARAFRRAGRCSTPPSI